MSHRYSYRFIMNNKSQQSKYKPTVKDMFTLPYTGYSTINPSGTRVAYLRGIIDLKENSFGAYCHIYDCDKKLDFQLTKDAYASNIRWIDDDTLVIIKYSPKEGNRQIFLYDNLVGDGLQLTNHSSSINNFEIFQEGFIFLTFEPAMNKKIGNFAHVEEEEGSSKLYYLNTKLAKKNISLRSNFFEEEKEDLPKPYFELTQLFDESFHIDSFVVSPKEDSIYLNCRKKPDLHFQDTKFHYRIELDAQKVLDRFEGYRKSGQDVQDYSFLGEVKKLALPRDANILAVSPDGDKILLKHKGRDYKDQTQGDLWILNIAENEDNLDDETTISDALFCLTHKLDQEPAEVQWTKTGIYLSYWNESICELARFQEPGDFEVLDLQDLSIKYFFDFNDKGEFCFSAYSANKLDEIYLAKKTDTNLKFEQLTNFTDQHSSWDFGTVESIKWKSKDGEEIEGILRKPSDFDPSKKYPLLFIIHGGPAASSPLTLLEGSETIYKPSIQMSNKGVIILSPNYRGSTGKGQRFRELNFDNLGVGDLWDIESGIDYLVEQGFIDETRIGCMGSSQGGYISAFVGMHSSRFKAVSVGSCAASWYTYYITSDVRDSILLAGEPFSKERQASIKKTAPIAGIETANTPMLLQHGANDQRTGIANANELFRALKHKGVPVEFIKFNDAGHDYGTPRNYYALMLQNYRWFSHYLLDEELDLFKDDF